MLFQIAGAAILLSGSTTVTRADDIPAPATLDVPVPTNRAMPVWIGQPSTPPTTFATMTVPIIQPDPAASLLLTVYFTEKDGGFLRIIWNSPNGAQVISDNLYENIGMANQRSVLISADTMTGNGTLTFQTGASSLGIQRLKLEWVVNKPGLGPSDLTDPLVTSSSGQTVPQATLDGQPQTPQAAAWQNQFVTVPLADTPVRIEDGVQFSVDLDNMPVAARLSLQETGLTFGKHFAVWINDQYAGTISPSVPDLTDSGYFGTTASSTSYVGWRDGSFFVPVALLTPGTNTIQLDSEDDSDSVPANANTPTTGDHPPIAVKNFSLQLNYQPPPPQDTPPAPAPLLGPVSTEPAVLSPTSTTSSQ